MRQQLKERNNDAWGCPHAKTLSIWGHPFSPVNDKQIVSSTCKSLLAEDLVSWTIILQNCADSFVTTTYKTVLRLTFVRAELTGHCKSNSWDVYHSLKMPYRILVRAFSESDIQNIHGYSDQTEIRFHCFVNIKNKIIMKNKQKMYLFYSSTSYCLKFRRITQALPAISHVVKLFLSFI